MRAAGKEAKPGAFSGHPDGSMYSVKDSKRTYISCFTGKSCIQAIFAP